MNKFIYLMASCFTLLGTFYAYPYITKYPTTSNYAIFLTFLIFTLLGFYLFFRKPKTKVSPQIINGQQFTPVD